VVSTPKDLHLLGRATMAFETGFIASDITKTVLTLVTLRVFRHFRKENYKNALANISMPVRT
jgi:hypothetical protein